LATRLDDVEKHDALHSRLGARILHDHRTDAAHPPARRTMSKPSSTRVVVLCAALVAACATGQPAARTESSMLTRTEIEQGGSSIFTAREAVRILRPQWLTRPMGRVASSNVMTSGGGNQEVIVYIDDTRQPDFESLATVPAARIVEIKYLDQNRAVLLRGPGHEAGVIEVTTTDKRK
jgi:hypothetical protein